MVRRLTSELEARHGSTTCPVLIVCDLATPEGQRTCVEGRRVERCRRYVEDAARIAEGPLPAGR